MYDCRRDVAAEAGCEAVGVGTACLLFWVGLALLLLREIKGEGRADPRLGARPVGFREVVVDGRR